MAKRDVDPVLRELVRSVNESDQALVPVSLIMRGTVLRGSLISQARYFSELSGVAPLMSTLEPGSGLPGRDFAKDVEAEAGHYLHLRGTEVADRRDDAEGLWRIDIATVDAWNLPAAATGPEGEEGRVPPSRFMDSS
jgi:hypothetical protein